MNIEDQLNLEEGVHLKPYLDCCGKYWRECRCEKQGFLTVAVGLNLDAGLTTEEAFFLRDSRIRRARAEASSFSWFRELNSVRQSVIIKMIFNLGAAGFSEFKRLISALEKKEYERAANEMLASRWAGQVKGRAISLAAAMQTGIAP